GGVLAGFWCESGNHCPCRHFYRRRCLEPAEQRNHENIRGLLSIVLSVARHRGGGFAVSDRVVRARRVWFALADRAIASHRRTGVDSRLWPARRWTNPSPQDVQTLQRPARPGTSRTKTSSISFRESLSAGRGARPPDRVWKHPAGV